LERDDVPELFFAGFLIGVIVGAPIGPVGSATLLEITAGSTRRAVSGMAGCIVAEMVLLCVAVFGTSRLSTYLGSLPRIVAIAVGAAMVGIGIYYLLAAKMPRLGSGTTFIVAFKITLLAPNNLAALVALIAAMGLPAKLGSVAPNAAFMTGELFGVTSGWIILLLLGRRLRDRPGVQSAVPWLRRTTGAIMIVSGGVIIGQQIGL
jgi:putative LysE/RhtB family amino acid efflux pump